MMNRMEIKDK